MQADISTKQAKSIYSSKIIIATVMLLVASTGVTIGTKMQSDVYNYKHSFMQTLFIFAGEYLMIFFLFFQTLNRRAREREFKEIIEEGKKEQKSIQPNILWFSLTTLFDCVGIIFENIALMMLPASIHQVLTGANVVVTCIVSRIMLKREIHRHHALGNFFAIVGFVVVGYSEHSKEGSDSGTLFLGIAILILNLIASAVQVNTDELIFHKYEMSVVRAVGLEGLFGMLWIFLFICAGSFFACPSDSICDLGGYLEDPVIGTTALLDSLPTIYCSVVMCVSIAVYNFCFLTLTKDVSCVYSVFMNSLSIMSIWAVSVLLDLEPFEFEAFLWQAGGFCCILLGNVTYNEILPWRIFGLDKKLKKNLQKEQQYDADNSVMNATLEKPFQPQEGKAKGD